MENLKLYDQLKSVPKQFLKEIQAGRLKGMSDIKPQWRILKLTETFGACGFGWKIQNLNFTYQVGKENEIVCNCYLEFLYKLDGVWSEPIPAIGGSKLTTNEKNGAYVSDEAEKMAYTDAISVATKMIGLASDIYMGYGGKYENQQPQQPKPNLYEQVEAAKAKIIDANSLDDLTNKWKALTKVEQSFQDVIELSKKLAESFKNGK